MALLARIVTARRLVGLVVVAGLLHAGLVYSDNTYLYASVRYRWPDILDHEHFANREIARGEPQPWPRHAAYGRRALTAQQEGFIRGEMKTTAFLVIKNDELLFEKYWEGFDARSRTDSFSMAKSVVSILIGVAIGEGKITGVRQTLGELVPMYRGTDKAGIRLYDLLTMSSGLDYVESYGNPFADSAKAYYTHDLAAQAYGLQRNSMPGKIFHYQSANQVYLAQVLAQVTGMKLSDYASQKLWQPLHAEDSALWSLDHEGGLEKAYCCIAATARDFARLGSLYLHGGRFAGQQLVPEEYVNASLQPAQLLEQSGKPCTRYGYSWWLMEHRGKRVFSAKGILGQLITVLPDEQLVLVRLGHEMYEPDGPQENDDLRAYVDAALELAK
jgi:CubicO group peptidase (beta-lactamase class C family)